MFWSVLKNHFVSYFIYYQRFDKNHDKLKHLKTIGGPHKCGLTFLVVHYKIKVEGTSTKNLINLGFIFTLIFKKLKLFTFVFLENTNEPQEQLLLELDMYQDIAVARGSTYDTLNKRMDRCQENIDTVSDDIQRLQG